MAGKRMSSVLVALGVLVSAGSIEIPDPGVEGETDYCGESFKCGEEKHFACTHKERTTGKIVVVVSGGYVVVNCSEMTTHITPKERGIVLQAVNDFRNEIAVAVTGGGSDIRQLTWDYKLEKFARVLATNTESADKSGYWVRACAKTGSGNTSAVFFTFPKGDVNVRAVAGVWGRRNVTENRPTEDVESLTALASASATKLGCGYSDAKCDGGDVSTVACFVGFEVNLVGHPVFRIGSPCGNCPPHTKCNPKSQWPRLCAGPGDPEKSEDIPDPIYSASSVHRLSLITPFLIATSQF